MVFSLNEWRCCPAPERPAQNLSLTKPALFCLMAKSIQEFSLGNPLTQKAPSSPGITAENQVHEIVRAWDELDDEQGADGVRIFFLDDQTRPVEGVV